MYEVGSVHSLVLPILAYHELYVTQEEEKYCLQTMGPSCALQRDIFRHHLDVIARDDIQAVTFADLSCFQPRQAPRGRKELALTFDDGHAGNYHYAYPLLAERKMAAVFFVTTNLIGRKKMMSWDQVREMADNGMSIQSHGVSHEPFETLSPAEIVEELSSSKKIIEDKTGQKVNTISLPHGSMHRTTLEKAEKSGYEFVCTSIIDYFSPSSVCGIMEVPRISISGNIGLGLYGEIINGTAGDIYRWKRNQRIKYVIKKVVGISNYRRIYRLVHNIQLNE